MEIQIFQKAEFILQNKSFAYYLYNTLKIKYLKIPKQVSLIKSLKSMKTLNDLDFCSFHLKQGWQKPGFF